MRLEIRSPRLSDAQRFFDILNNPAFIHFAAKPKTVKAEEEWIKKSRNNRRKNIEYNFAVIYENKLVGGIGIKIDQHQKHIGEIGYFIDYDYWGQGIATEAVKVVEKFALNKLKLKRLEIRMYPRNKASVKVAIKAGYKREGLLKKSFNANGKLRDSFLYAKVK